MHTPSAVDVTLAPVMPTLSPSELLAIYLPLAELLTASGQYCLTPSAPHVPFGERYRVNGLAQGYYFRRCSFDIRLKYMMRSLHIFLYYILKQYLMTYIE